MSHPAELQSLSVLLAHAERQRDESLVEHRRMQYAADAARVQSAQLVEYRSDYEARWNTRFQHQGEMELVRCYHQFMDKLSQALEHQRRVEAHAAQQAENSEAQLRACELRCASVRKLLERRLQETRRGAAQRDQKQTDEDAMRAAWAQRDTPHRF